MVFGSAAGKEKHMNAMLTNITKQIYKQQQKDRWLIFFSVFYSFRLYFCALILTLNMYDGKKERDVLFFVSLYCICIYFLFLLPELEIGWWCTNKLLL